MSLGGERTRCIHEIRKHWARGHAQGIANDQGVVSIVVICRQVEEQTAIECIGPVFMHTGPNVWRLIEKLILEMPGEHRPWIPSHTKWEAPIVVESSVMQVHDLWGIWEV